MQNIPYKTGEVLSHPEAFDGHEFGDHGIYKTGFGDRNESPDNAVDVRGMFNAGDRLRESVTLTDGSSGMGATAGGDRDIVVSSEPFDEEGNTQGHIVGILKYRQGDQPKLYAGPELEPVVGGSNQISMFVSETGAPDEDPKPRLVSDSTQPETYSVNRYTGLAAYRDYYWRIFRHGVNEGRYYASLTMQAGGTTPKTETIYEVPVGAFCTHCGQSL